MKRITWMFNKFIFLGLIITVGFLFSFVHTIISHNTHKPRVRNYIAWMKDNRWEPDHPLWSNITLPSGWFVLTSTRPMTPFVMITSHGFQMRMSLLPQEGGGLQENIQRWQKQMGLSMAEAQQHTKIETITSQGLTAHWIEIEEANNTGSSSTLVAVMIPLHEQTLFFKLLGPKNWIKEDKRQFRAWIDSDSLRILLQRLSFRRPAS